MGRSERARIRESDATLSSTDVADSLLLDESAGQRQSLLPYLQLFWGNRRLLVRATLGAVVASVVIALLIPNRYQSTTSLMPPDNQSQSGLGLLAAVAGGAVGGGAGSLGGLQSLAGDLFGLKTSGDLFIGILQSETAKDKLIAEFHLQKEYHDKKIEDARKDLADHTDISQDRKSGIISIAVTDHSPTRAAAMAQAYVAELNVLVAKLSTSSARRERIFLDGRIAKVKGELETAEKNFSDFASKNTAIDIPAQGKAMVAAAATLQGELIGAQAELSGLEQIYTGNNARVRAAQARVDELQRKLDEIGGAGTQTQIQNNDALYPSIRKLPLLGVKYADLYRQTKVEEAVYEYLTQQDEAAKIQEAKEIPTVRVLDVAMVPTKKSFPPRGVIVVLGTILGATLAMSWIIGKTRWDAIEETDPRKIFAGEVFGALHARAAQFSRNGAKPEPVSDPENSENGRH